MQTQGERPPHLGLHGGIGDKRRAPLVQCVKFNTIRYQRKVNALVRLF